MSRNLMFIMDAMQQALVIIITILRLKVTSVWSNVVRAPPDFCPSSNGPPGERKV